MIRLVLLVVAIVWATPAVAQVELGMDAGLQFLSYGEGEDGVGFEIPFRVLRVGVAVAPHVQFELAGNFLHGSFDEISVTEIFAFPYLMLSARADPSAGSSPFLAMGVGIDRELVNDDGDTESDTQFGYGGILGYRASVSDAFAIRLGLDVTHWNETDEEQSSNLFTLAVGFSVFP